MAFFLSWLMFAWFRHWLSRRKKEEKRASKLLGDFDEEGRRKKSGQASFWAMSILRLIRWAYLIVFA
jgi:hypothetical protein